MDTHLTLLNEDVVREREHAMRHASERATARTDAAAARRASASTEERVEPAGRMARGLDLVVVTLFAVLAAGFVSLVATTIRL